MKYLLATLLLGLSLSAQAAKTYQVTGNVLEVSDSKLVIDKKGEKFEMDRSAATKVSGDLKVGSKVTANYSMTAVNVEVKAEKASKEEKAEKPKKAKK